MTSQKHCTLVQLAASLQTALADETPDTFWDALSSVLQTEFGHTSCTILSYNPISNTLLRLYSSRPDAHRPGGRKRVSEGSAWAQTVLHNGQLLVGSTAEDIRRLFSEHESLIANGWESILNIPIRDNGKTIGSINLMAAAHMYDAGLDEPLARAFAQVCVPVLRRAEAAFQDDMEKDEKLEYV